MSYIGQTLPADTFQGFTTDSFTGDGSATTFTLSKTPFSEDTLIVVINNVIQKPTTNFTVSGTTLTIVGTAVASGDVIYAIHMGGPLPIGGAASLDLNGASDKLILDADADTTISADTDDQIDFKAGGTDIFQLTATTATFNDGVSINIDDNSDGLTITSTDADATNGPGLRLFRNSASPADSDDIGRIIFSGENDASEQINYGIIRGDLLDVTDGTEDGIIKFEAITAGTNREIARFGNGVGAVFNEDGIQANNFRVEGDGDTHLIFAGATGADNNDRVYLGYYTSADVTDATMIFSTDRNEEVTRIFASHSTYGEDVIHGDATRAATSSYNLIRMTSGGNNDSEMIVDGAGAAFFDGVVTAAGFADYAEYFEWNDGNSSDEDRVGISVKLLENKIVASSSSDDASDIIGVVSGSPVIVGDGDMPDNWNHKYLRDEWNRFIYEDYTITEWEEEQTNIKGIKSMVTVFYETDKIPDNVTPPSDAVVKSTEIDGSTKLQRKKLNSAYDPALTYVPRSKRKEWDMVGIMGKLRIKKGQKTGTNWIKMRDISDTVEEWLVR